MKTATRVYESKKWRTKRVAGIPLPLAVLLIVAGLAIAGVTGTLISKTQPANNSPQSVAIQFKVGTAPPTTVFINTLVAPTLQAQAQNGFAGTVHLVVSIGSNSAAETCATLANALESAVNAYDGKIQWKTGAGAFSAIGLASGTSGAFTQGGVSYLGGCQYVEQVTPTYTVTGTMADAFVVNWAWSDVPQGSTISFLFAYATP